MKFLLLLLGLCSTSLALAQKLIILHTNDHHGKFMPNANGDHGLAQQSTLVKKIREEARKNGDFVLVLSAGDINTGSPESDMFDAEPDIRAMNEIGYDVMVLGNHEFDNPAPVLRRQEQLAKFDFISANTMGPDGKPAFKPYVTKILGGKKVAIVGFTTPDSNLTAPENLGGLTIVDPFESTRELVKELEKTHDLVIGLSHLGYYENESHGSLPPGDETLAKKNPELDYIVGGHSHTELQQPVKIGNTGIVQAKESGYFVGKLEIDLSTNKMTNYQLIPVKGFESDPAITRITDPYMQEAKVKLDEKIGTTVSEFKGGRGVIDTSQMPLGKLVATGQRKKVSADIAIVQAKGLRTGLPAGEVKLRHVLSISPFGNTLTTATLTGKELWKTVQALQDEFLASGEMVYFSDNVEVKTAGNKVTEIRYDGKVVPDDDSGGYKIVANNYITEIVPSFAFIRNHPTFRNTGITDAQALVSFVKENPNLDPKAFGHKSYVEGKACPAAIEEFIKKP